MTTGRQASQEAGQEVVWATVTAVLDLTDILQLVESINDQGTLRRGCLILATSCRMDHLVVDLIWPYTLLSEDCGLNSVANVKLLQKVRHVMLHRLFG